MASKPQGARGQVWNKFFLRTLRSTQPPPHTLMSVDQVRQCRLIITVLISHWFETICKYIKMLYVLRLLNKIFSHVSTFSFLNAVFSVIIYFNNLHWWFPSIILIFQNLFYYKNKVHQFTHLYIQSRMTLKFIMSLLLSECNFDFLFSSITT